MEKIEKNKPKKRPSRKEPGLVFSIPKRVYDAVRRILFGGEEKIEFDKKDLDGLDNSIAFFIRLLGGAYKFSRFLDSDERNIGVQVMSPDKGPVILAVIKDEEGVLFACMPVDLSKEADPEQVILNTHIHIELTALINITLQTNLLCTLKHVGKCIEGDEIKDISMRD